MSRQAPQAPTKASRNRKYTQELPKNQPKLENAPELQVDFLYNENYNERIHSFLAMNDDLNSFSTDEIKEILNQSTMLSGFAYNYRDLIALKVMADDDRSRREIEYYRYFTRLVLKNSSPHFPLVSRCEWSNVCVNTKKYGSLNIPTTIKVNKDENKTECFILFSELGDGSLDSVVGEMSLEQVISMIFQVCMACALLERKGIVHGDLHFGNILFHSEEAERENKGKWLWYRINDFDIYVKHMGSLWVLCDFGMMVGAGKKDTRAGEETFTVTDTFTSDIKMTFFPLIKKTFNRGFDGYTHQFIEVLAYLLDENTSIITVLNLLAYNNYYDMIRAEWKDDMDVINSHPYIV
jgi:serine/threonine protein kinase